MSENDDNLRRLMRDRDETRRALALRNSLQQSESARAIRDLARAILPLTTTALLVGGAFWACDQKLFNGQFTGKKPENKEALPSWEETTRPDGKQLKTPEEIAKERELKTQEKIAQEYRR